MLNFIIKGLLRDKNRSLFPVIIVATGVMLTVLMHAWISGVLNSMLTTEANFSDGHLKVVTQAYADNSNLMPNDLAIMGSGQLLQKLNSDYPNLEWVQRIRFGGLVDIPDSDGETRSQGTAIGMSIDLLNPKSNEVQRLGIKDAIVRGRLPQQKNEVLLSDEFAEKLEVEIGQPLTLISSTMFGSMAMENFVLCGTIRFGISAMDRGAILADITTIQSALDMEDATAEILGFFPDGNYHDAEASEITKSFNAKHKKENDIFSPKMMCLMEQGDLAGMWEYISGMIGLMIFVFIFAMSLVLWNTGLIGGLRRYGEIGLRLAVGEDKGRLYRSMIYESVVTGLIGSIVGTIIGLGLAYILETKGLDLSSMLKNSSMLMPNVYRAQITTPAFYIGFIPGLFSTVLGTSLSGFGIFKRQTATLFKELEV